MKKRRQGDSKGNGSDLASTYADLLAQLPKEAQPDLEKVKGNKSYKVIVGDCKPKVEVLLDKRTLFVRGGKGVANISVSFGPRSGRSPAEGWAAVLAKLRGDELQSSSPA